MPLVSRDEIKEGYVNTFGVKHDELPPDANARATELFFRLVQHYLEEQVSIVIEAAFQHGVWESRLPAMQELASVCIVLCDIDDAVKYSRDKCPGGDGRTALQQWRTLMAMERPTSLSTVRSNGTRYIQQSR